MVFARNLVVIWGNRRQIWPFGKDLSGPGIRTAAVFAAAERWRLIVPRLQSLPDKRASAGKREASGNANVAMLSEYFDSNRTVILRESYLLDISTNYVK